MIRNNILLLVMTVLFSTMFIRDAVSGQQVDVEHYGFSSEGDKNLPFSAAVRVGHLLFLSGQVGNMPGTMSVVPGGYPRTEQQSTRDFRTDREPVCAARLDNQRSAPDTSDGWTGRGAPGCRR